jgi:broad specificity phosphatase PhoE
MHQVFLVRHALRADTEDPAWGKTAARPDDPPLSASGFEQARAVGAYLEPRGIAALYCSPFLRALQTAQMIYEQTLIPFRADEALSEWLRPTWFSAKPQFLSADELQKEFSGYDASYRSSTVATFPEAEEGTDVYTRVKQFLEALDRKESGNVVLVGHGASMTQAVRALCGEGLDIEVASVTEVERVDDQWKSQGSILPYRLTK